MMSLSTYPAFGEQQKKTNIWALRYLEFAQFGYLFAIPVIVDYVTQYSGGATEAFFYLSLIVNCVAIVMSLFVGAVSDIYSRKSMMIFGFVCRMTAWSLFIFFPGYWSFLVGMILFGLGMASVDCSTCLYETMQASRDNKNYRRQERIMHSWSQYAMMIGLPIAGGLYLLDPIWPFALNIMTSALAIGVVIFFYSEAPREKSEHKRIGVFLKNTVSFLRKTHRLRWMTLFSGVMSGLFYMQIFIFQATFLELGGSVAMFSVLISAIYFMRGLGAHWTEAFLRRFERPTIGLICLFGVGMSIMLASGLAREIWLFVLLILGFMLVRGLLSPAIKITYNDIITSDKRATGFKTIELISRICLILFHTCIAVGIEHYGASTALLVLSGIILVLGGGFLWLSDQAFRVKGNFSRQQ